jgi:hypothetical protein
VGGKPSVGVESDIGGIGVGVAGTPAGALILSDCFVGSSVAKAKVAVGGSPAGGASVGGGASVVTAAGISVGGSGETAGCTSVTAPSGVGGSGDGGIAVGVANSFN